MSDTLPLLRLLAGQLRQGMSEDDRHRWALVVDGIAEGMMPPCGEVRFVNSDTLKVTRPCPVCDVQTSVSDFEWSDRYEQGRRVCPKCKANDGSVQYIPQDYWLREVHKPDPERGAE